MIEIFKGIDLILVGSSWVRWALIGVSLSLLIITIVSNGIIREKDHEIMELQKNLAKVAAELQVQNRAIEEVGKEADAQKKAYESSVTRATKIAVELRSAIDRLNDIELVGSCDDKVKQTIDLIRNKRNN